MTIRQLLKEFLCRHNWLVIKLNRGVSTKYKCTNCGKIKDVAWCSAYASDKPVNHSNKRRNTD